MWKIIAYIKLNYWKVMSYHSGIIMVNIDEGPTLLIFYLLMPVKPKSYRLLLLAFLRLVSGSGSIHNFTILNFFFFLFSGSLFSIFIFIFPLLMLNFKNATFLFLINFKIMNLLEFKICWRSKSSSFFTTNLLTRFLLESLLHGKHPSKSNNNRCVYIFIYILWRLEKNVAYNATYHLYNFKLLIERSR